MAPKFDFKRVYTSSSERVKCTDIHPIEPWILVGLYNGQLNIHNYENQAIIKTFDVCQVPIRAGIFVSRKNWVICGSDDLLIYVFNYNTLEKVHSFEGHFDYLRYICVHPTRSFIITCGDDMLIKVWDWDRKWECVQKLEGHHHYVMQIAINPKDNNQIASASLDRKIKIWQLGNTTTANLTLEGHDKGVNTIDYCHSADKPYLISGADDWNIKVWDYQNKSCIHTLSGHTNNVLRTVFHPNLPFIISASEDGCVRIWDLSTFKCQNTLNYGMGRIWTVSVKQNSHELAVGFDNGMIVFRVGKDAPICSMDTTGKVYIARQTSLYTGNVKNAPTDIKNEEKIAIPYTELGTSEIYPQSLVCSPSGRYITVWGNGEYVIYTPISLRSKMLGNADHFAWSNDPNIFAISDSSNLILYKNFKEIKRLNTGYSIEELFGDGALLTVSTSQDVYFYDWSELRLIIKIDVAASSIYWNSTNTLCCICDSSAFHLLKFNNELVESTLNSNQLTEFGISEAFEPITDIEETVLSGYWISDCFVFTNKNNRISYLIGDRVFNMYHTDKIYYIVGYISAFNRLYVVDKETNIMSFSLEMPLIEYQSAILQNDYEYAQQVLPSVSSSSLNQLAIFLEDLKLYDIAINITPDEEHKFELALNLNNIDEAYKLAKLINNKNKWKLLAKIAINRLRFDIAVECYKEIHDPIGLYLLSVVLNNKSVLDIALDESIQQKNTNLTYLIYYSTGQVEKAIELLKSAKMNAHATILAYTHQPNMLVDTFEDWQRELQLSSPKQAGLLAHPQKYPNLFPNFNQTEIEQNPE